MFISCRRKEQPWEVVDCRAVEPVPSYHDDEDLDVLFISKTETRGTYVFDIRSRTEQHLRRLVIFAQQQLLREVKKRGLNTFLTEGWTLTLLRKGKHQRVEVQYIARAAKIGKPCRHHRPPPFMGVLCSAH